MKQTTFTVRHKRQTLLDKLRSRSYTSAELRRVAEVFEGLKHSEAAQLCRDEAEVLSATEQIRATPPKPSATASNDSEPPVLLCQYATEMLGLLEKHPRATFYVTTSSGLTFALRPDGEMVVLTGSFSSECGSLNWLHHYLTRQAKPFFVEARHG